MKRFLLLLFILTVTVAMEAQKQPGRISTRGEKFTRTENSLLVEMTVDTRELRIPTTDALILVPEIYCGEDVVQLPHLVINGHKRHKIYLRENAMGMYKSQGPEYKVIESGMPPGAIDYSYTVPFEMWMKGASLRLRQESCGCPGEKQLFGDYPVAENILGEKEQPSEETALFLHFLEPRKEELKTRSEYGEAYLHFIVDKWDILYDYKDNARKLDQVQAFFNQAQNDKNISVEGITITGYASPEATWEHNMQLSQNRAGAFASWVQSRFRFPYNIYKVQWKGEDWDKLLTLVEESYMPEKYQVIDIIRRRGIFDGRELQLMQINGGRTYNYMLVNLFPQLRRVHYRIEYTVRSFTVEESKELLGSKPQQLSLFEMYAAANTYRRGSREFNQAMRKAVELNPEDPAANNNAAAVALQEGRLQEGKALLDKTPDSPARDNNLGVYYLLSGDPVRARTAFEKALKGGISDARHNLEISDKQAVITRERERQAAERLRIEQQRKAEELRIQEQRRAEELRAQEAERKAREEAERQRRMEELNKKKAVPYKIQ